MYDNWHTYVMVFFFMGKMENNITCLCRLAGLRNRKKDEIFRQFRSCKLLFTHQHHIFQFPDRMTTFRKHHFSAAANCHSCMTSKKPQSNTHKHTHMTHRHKQTHIPSLHTHIQNSWRESGTAAAAAATRTHTPTSRQ